MIININSNKHGNQEMIIDDEDYHLVKPYKIAVTRIGHNLYPLVSIKKNGKWTKEYVHRIVSVCPKGKVVDHINRNTLDNRKLNLRVCGQSINSLNRDNKTKTGFSNVNKVGNKFRAMIHIEGKHFHGGYFDTPEEAYKKVTEMKEDQFRKLTGHNG